MRVGLRAALEWIGWQLVRKARGPEDPNSVFVSYAHEDEQSVSQLVSELDKRGFKAVWFARKQLQPGDRLNPEIRKAIDKAEYFVVAVTHYSRNSEWVAREIEYALEREKKGVKIRLIPIYLTSRDVPESLRDYLAIDMRDYVYKAGFEDLVYVLGGKSGKLPRGRTPLSRFEQFIGSLAIVDEEVESAIDNIRMDHFILGGRRREEAEEAKRLGEKGRTEDRFAQLETLARQKDEAEAILREHLQRTETLLSQKGLPSSDRERIMGVLNLGRLPPALLKPQSDEIRAWLRSGTPATLSIACALYARGFTGWPVTHIIGRGDIVQYVNNWVNRGEIPLQEAPDPDWLIQRLIEEKLIRPFKRSEYVDEADEEFQLFHAGERAKSVGKAAYLFAIYDPDERGDHYSIGRFLGSTPKGVFA